MTKGSKRQESCPFVSSEYTLKIGQDFLDILQKILNLHLTDSLTVFLIGYNNYGEKILKPRDFTPNLKNKFIDSVGRGGKGLLPYLVYASE